MISQTPTVHSANSQAVTSSCIVVGTGVVGLALALGCAQRGLSVTLLGPAPSAPDPRAFEARIYAISPAATALLSQLRVWSQVNPERICPVEAMRVFGDLDGELRFDARTAGVERLATIVEEAELRRILWLSCVLNPAIAHVPQAFVGASWDTQQRLMRVEVADRDAPGNPEGIKTTLCAHLLVGADGRQSAVRNNAQLSAQVTPYGQTAVVANLACTLPHGNIAHQWFTSQGVVALLPLPGKAVSLVWSVPHEHLPVIQALDNEAFALRLESLCGRALGTLTLTGARHEFELSQLIVQPVSAPGLVLVGDAAHGVHPLAGQGLNLGLQDVEVFLQQLDRKESWRHLGDPVWLRRYERRRSEPVALMRGTVGILAHLFDSPKWPLPWVRNRGMSLVNTLAPIKQALIRHAMGKSIA